MSRYPSATWKPIGGTGTQPLTKDLLCLHTAIGGGLSTWNYFNRADIGVYSHLVVCGVWGSDAGQDVDGLTLQMADTDYRAAANLDGNWHIISVETGDNADRPIAPWTAAQCEALAQVMADANRLDGIPLVLVPDSQPGRRGICYHRLGCDPYRVDGGELWSSAYGKDCPTQARIDQIPAIIARARAIVAGTPEDDRPTIDELNAAAAAGKLDPFFRRQTTLLRDTAGLATSAQVTTAVQQLAGRIVDARTGVLAAIAALPTDGLSDADRAALVQDIVAGVDALGPGDAQAVADALAARPATVTFGPAT